jgi:LysM repeat protein
MYKMYFGINNGQEGFILPVLPEKIRFSESGDNKTYDLINLGEINTINLPKLTKISFESYFPFNNGPYVTSEKLFEPAYYVNKIREWRNKLLKIRFIFTGSPLEVNELFTIENFELTENGGEVGDIYYDIELKKYKNYGAKKVVVITQQAANSNTTTIVEKSAPVRPIETTPVNTHIVAAGDTLWYVAKRYLGNGNRFTEIAKLNDIKNPDNIIVGQQLKLPEVMQV